MAVENLHSRVPPHKCSVCKVWFTPVKPIRRKWGVQTTPYNGKKTCSRECLIRFYKEDQARKDKIGAASCGEKHWNWQGGKSLLNNINGRGIGWQAQRRKAIRRDNWRCVHCGTTDDECRSKYGRGLDVNHIIPFHNFRCSKEANRIPNLESVCAGCHRRNEQTSGVQMMLPYADSQGRRHKGYARGEKVNTAKLTSADVAVIRRRAKLGHTISELAADYSVCKTNVSMIVKRETWRHVA